MRIAQVTSPRLRVALFVLAGLTVLAGVAGVSLLPVQRWLTATAMDLRLLGWPGALLFACFYALATLVLIPASALSLIAGLVYGLWGLPISWAAMMAASAISFPLSRRHLAGPIRSRAERQRHVRTVLEVIDEEGWWMVLLVRISGFIPFGLQSYVLGLTRVGFRPYLVATSLGVMPSILVYGGAGAFGNAALAGWGDNSRIALLSLAVLANLTLIVLSGRRVKARLAQQAEGALQTPCEPPGPPDRERPGQPVARADRNRPDELDNGMSGAARPARRP